MAVFYPFSEELVIESITHEEPHHPKINSACIPSSSVHLFKKVSEKELPSTSDQGAAYRVGIDELLYLLTENLALKKLMKEDSIVIKVKRNTMKSALECAHIARHSRQTRRKVVT